MPFCQNCGVQMNNGAKFCSECGAPMAQTKILTRQQEFGGRIIKCPNCGEILNSFETKCSACGYELRGAKTISAVKELELELNRIMEKRNMDDASKVSKVFARAFGVTSENPVDRQMADRISSFPIPNTQEDIFEFMILAVSNIDPMVHDTSSDGYMADREGKLLISNAWEAKYNQAYQKARIMLSNDSRLAEIAKLYEMKQKQINRNKRKVFIAIAVYLGFMMLLLCISVVAALGLTS